MERRNFIKGVLGAAALALAPFRWAFVHKPRTCKFVGPGTDWADPGNWSSRRVPTNGDSVILLANCAADKIGIRLDNVTMGPGCQRVGLASATVKTLTLPADTKFERLPKDWKV